MSNQEQKTREQILADFKAMSAVQEKTGALEPLSEADLARAEMKRKMDARAHDPIDEMNHRNRDRIRNSNAANRNSKGHGPVADKEPAVQGLDSVAVENVR